MEHRKLIYSWRGNYNVSSVFITIHQTIYIYYRGSDVQYSCLERPASFGIMDAKLKLPWKSSTSTAFYRIEGSKEALNWAPIMPRENRVFWIANLFYFSLPPNEYCASHSATKKNDLKLSRMLKRKPKKKEFPIFLELLV